MRWQKRYGGIATLKILVTGGAGFIGSHLVKELSKKNQVIIIQRDFIPSKWLDEALTNCIIVKGDITNQSLLYRVISDYNIEQVYHLAAQAIVSSAYKDPITTFNVNVIGTVNLLEAVRQVNPEIPIYVQSTDKVYSDKIDAKETDPIVASGIYETSKACQDLTAQAYASLYGLKVIIGRACNTYGFDQAKRIIPNTIKQCLRKEQPIIYEGEPSFRQYIYVKDHVSAMLHLTNKSHSSYPAIYNIGTNDILTQTEVVEVIASYFGAVPKIVKREKPLKELQSQSLNYTKLFETGWRPRYDFSNGIKETIKKFEEYKNE